MKHWIATIGTLAVLGLGADAARADVTAEEVWQNWQTVAASMGQGYSAGTVLRGDGTLTLRDVIVTATTPGATMDGAIDEIAFRELSDGTVAITPSPTYSMTVKTDQPGGDVITQQVTVIQDALNLIASGDPEAISYDFTAERITLRADGPTSAHTDAAMDLTVSAEDITGRYLVTAESLASDLTARTLTLTLDVTETGSQAALDIQAADVAVTGEGALGIFSDPAGFIARGQGANTTLTYADLRYSLKTTQNGATSTFGAAADTGAAKLTLGTDGLRYGVENTGLTFALSGAQIPLPQISASLARANFNLRMPVVVSDTPQDFALRIDLDQLSLADAVWNMLDGGQVLPRDPAILTLDITGTANWLTDIRDMAQTDARAPAELHALQVSELRLSAGGAELTGSGNFTFDNSDLTTFRGMPAPDGALELQATGANTLIDSLVTLGLLPAEQAFFARIVAAPFLEAGDGPDTLQTRIEFGPDGSIRANGRPVQ